MKYSALTAVDAKPHCSSIFRCSSSSVSRATRRLKATYISACRLGQAGCEQQHARSYPPEPQHMQFSGFIHFSAHTETLWFHFQENLPVSFGKLLALEWYTASSSLRCTLKPKLYWNWECNLYTHLNRFSKKQNQESTKTACCSGGGMWTKEQARLKYRLRAWLEREAAKTLTNLFWYNNCYTKPCAESLQIRNQHLCSIIHHSFGSLPETKELPSPHPIPGLSYVFQRNCFLPLLCTREILQHRAMLLPYYSSWDKLLKAHCSVATNTGQVCCW